MSAPPLVAPTRMRIDRLAFYGPERKSVAVDYGRGLTIVWGASNHGKSFSAQAIDFVLGAKGSLEVPPEGRGFDRCTLWLTFTDGTQVTLQRAVAGGAVEMAEGHLNAIADDLPGYASLRAQHAENGTSLSTFLLDRIGFRRAILLRNERADKAAFTFRQLMRYLFIDEDRIWAKHSVTMRAGDKPTAEDKSLLKFLVTGVDGSAVATVPSKVEQVAARDGKIALLKEFLEETSADVAVGETDDALEEVIERAETERDGADAALRERQEELDAARAALDATRRSYRDVEARTADLRTMKFRFNQLRRTLTSDIARLQGLEEGGFLTRKFAQMNCPLCGADSAHQHHDPHLDRIAKQQEAVAGETDKVQRERRDLDDALTRIDSEIAEDEAIATSLKGQMDDERTALQKLTGNDQGVRERFVTADDALRRLRAEQDRRRRADAIERRIATLEAEQVPGRPRAEDFDPSLSTAEAHDLARTVKRVLVAWGYPDVETVIFDLTSQDLIVDGKERRGNGKGVRAILQSAFHVALLLYCRENDRPHPGFLILDTPLRAYRAPTEGEDLEADDEALAKTGLAERFYAHLAELSEMGQFVVIENETPPNDLPESVATMRYDGGAGLFSQLQ